MDKLTDEQKKIVNKKIEAMGFQMYIKMHLNNVLTYYSRLSEFLDNGSIVASNEVSDLANLMSGEIDEIKFLFGDDD